MNFSLKDYNAHNQNWSITQSIEGDVYIANNKGLLEYNGANWNLVNSPNNTILRSVKAIGDRIYSGCYMEFGYWERNKFNQLEYTSLSNSIKNQLVEDEQFWGIIEYEEKILFQSLNRIYIYDVKANSVNPIIGNSSIIKLYKTNSSIYFQKDDKGL